MQGSKKIFELTRDQNGQGNVVISWSQDYSFLAICGEKRNLYILDRRGKKLRENQLQNSSKVSGLEWDKDNENLCICQEGLPFVMVWNVFNSQNFVNIESDNPKNKVTFAKWSKTHPVLAIGTEKGTLIFYNKKNQKKIPTMGKHSKKIVSGDWNKDGLLITGGEDRILTVSNYNSDTQYESVGVKAEPRMIRWARQKTDSSSDSSEKSVTAILQQKSLLMFELNSTKQPLELVFEQKYGKIVGYSLFGDGYIVVGFSEGYVAHISTHIKELKDEVSSERVFNNQVEALCTNDMLYKMAVAGDNSVKIYNMSTWKEIKNERIEIPKIAGRVNSLSWTQNGQLLVVSTSNGYLYGFQMSVPFVTAEYGNLSAVLTSFTEVGILDLSKAVDQNGLVSVTLENEPGVIAIGPYHLATGMNNMVWYYQWNDHMKRVIKGGQLVLKKDYFASVKKVMLNSKWSAIFIEGKCIAHQLQNLDNEENLIEKRFPNAENEKPIIQIGLTEHFLFMLDNQGKIRGYHLDESENVFFYKPQYQITRIYPNLSGTKIICIDNQGKGYYFNCAQQFMIPIESFPQKLSKIIWDQNDPQVFIVIENDNIHTYIIIHKSVNGCQTIPVRELLQIEDLENSPQVSKTILDKGLKPLSLVNGFLTCFTQLGTLQGQNLASHSYLFSWKGQDDSPEGHYRFFLQNLMLCRYQFCLMVGEYLQEPHLFEILGRKCLEQLEFDVAARAFQKCDNLSMVLTIDSIKAENDKNVLMGYVAMILGNYDRAQELFLKSAKPMLALDMRSDIQDWLIALNLSKSIASDKEPIICKKLAFQIENQGNYNEAQRLYEKSILKPDESQMSRKETEDHNFQCYAGIARTSIKLGDITRGFNIANDLRDNQMIMDIAIVCENMKQYYEAAQLYEKAGLAEKAASLYITLKMFNQATPLISKIKSPKLLSQLAKSKEAEGNYKEAEKAYELAEDWESVIRLNASYLDNFQKAKAIFRTKSQTVSCSTILADFCEKRGLKKDAIEFYIMAQKREEAFILAQTHDEMPRYCEILEKYNLFSTDQHMKVAQFFEGKSNLGFSARHYQRAGEDAKALQLFKKAGEEFLDDAIDMVGKSKKDSLILSLLDYLMGEDDGIPKNPNFTYKLYKQLGKIRETVTIAVTIASEEQEKGNYKNSQQYLFEVCQDMKKDKLVIPQELYQKLLIIHSYIIVKRIIKLNEHEDAAHLLNRVCKNISQFPSHAVTILTSTVVEATKANYKNFAYQWSCVLVRPEYRNQINEKYKNRIENIARKPVKEEIEQKKSSCPFCKELVSEYDVDCTSCQNNIPFCIASGKHIVANELCFCPKCDFPANATYFRRILEIDNTCPMCNEVINISDIKEDPLSINKLKQQFQESKDSKEKKETRDSLDEQGQIQN